MTDREMVWVLLQQTKNNLDYLPKTQEAIEVARVFINKVQQRNINQSIPLPGERVLFWNETHWCSGVFLQRDGELAPGIFEGPLNIYNHKNLNGCAVEWWMPMPPPPNNLG